MPQDKSHQEKIKKLIEDNCLKEGFDILGWRVCPTQTGDLGWSVLPSTPDVFQLFIKRSETQNSQDSFERSLYILRRCIEESVFNISSELEEGFYIPSL